MAGCIAYDCSVITEPAEHQAMLCYRQSTSPIKALDELDRQSEDTTGLSSLQHVGSSWALTEHLVIGSCPLRVGWSGAEYGKLQSSFTK
jgi:hypothetical protein